MTNGKWDRVFMLPSWMLPFRAFRVSFRTQAYQVLTVTGDIMCCWLTVCSVCVLYSCVVLWKFVSESCHCWTALTVCMARQSGHGDGSLRGVVLIYALLLMMVCCLYSSFCVSVCYVCVWLLMFATSSCYCWVICLAAEAITVSRCTITAFFQQPDELTGFTARISDVTKLFKIRIYRMQISTSKIRWIRIWMRMSLDQDLFYHLECNTLVYVN